MRLLSGLVGAVAVFALFLSGCDKESPTVYSDDVGTTIIYNELLDTLPVGVDSVFEVRIEMVEDVPQGRHQMVDVSMHWGNLRMDGLDFLFGYEAAAIACVGAVPGALFDVCGWEYFEYRFGPFGGCDNTCPSGMLRVVAIADMNNGDVHPDWQCYESLVAAEPYTLFSLVFSVRDDRTFECAFVPIRFFWIDCGDNSVAFYPESGSGVLSLGVSRYVFDKPDYADLIADENSGFPTATGWQVDCMENQNPDLPTLPQVDLINGGIQIICADSIDGRGDVDLNGTPRDIADAELFRLYFVYGLSAFTINTGAQIACTDVNMNGTTLELCDLVYLIRHVTADEMLPAWLFPIPASYGASDGKLWVDTEAAAAFVQVEGEHTPVLLADRMDLQYSFDGESTKILVSKIETGALFEGDFLRVDGSIQEFELATYTGAPVYQRRSPDETWLKVVNAPNPFGDSTTISFAVPQTYEFKAEISGASGRRVARFAGTAEPPGIMFVWDASVEPDGVYLCRLEVADLVVWHRMLKVKP